MNRERAEVVFTALLLVVIGLAVWNAQAWGIRARLFPWAIGIPLLVLLAALLVTLLARQLRAARVEPSALARPLAGAEATVERGEGAAAGEPADEAGAKALARRRGLVLVGWLLAFLAAIWLLGFPVGGTLGTLAYLKVAAVERWPMSLAVTAGTAAFFLLMIQGLNTPFPAGTLFELLPPAG